MAEDYIFRSQNPFRNTIPIKSTETKDLQSIATAVQTPISQLSKKIQLIERNGITSFDQTLMSQEEIAANSLLLQPIEEKLPEAFTKSLQCKDSKDAVLKLVANFLGGGLITGGKKIGTLKPLDGFQSIPNFIAWELILKDLYKRLEDKESPEGKILNYLIEEIAKLKEYSNDLETVENSRNDEAKLSEISLKYANRVKNLNSGEAHSFYTGWSNVGGGGGHAILTEVVRRSDGLFDVFTYTATGYQVADQIFAGNKKRQKPIVHYQAIPESVLLMNGDGAIRPAFIQSLIELRALKTWDINRCVEEKELLQIYDYLEPYRVPVPLEVMGAITGQRAGTCVPSSTKVWIRKHTFHIGLYKQIMFHAKLRLLLLAYQELQDVMTQDNERGEVSRRELAQVSRKLLRRIAKLSEGYHGFGALITSDLAKKAQATALHLLDEVKKCEDQIEKERATKTVEASLANLDVEKQKERWQKIAVKEKTFKAPTIPKELLPNLAWNISLDNPHALISTLDELLACDILKENRIRATIQLQHLIDQLPLPKINATSRKEWVNSSNDNFWSKLSSEDISKCIKQLERVVQIYIGMSFNDSFPRSYATILPLHQLIHFLALKLDQTKNHTEKEACLYNYSIPFFTECLAMEGLAYHDRREYDRIQEAVNYFETFNALPSNIGNRVLFKNEDKTEVVKDSIHQVLDNGIFWRALLTEDEKLTQIVNELANQLWPDLSDQEIRERHQQMVDRYQEWLNGSAFSRRHGYFPQPRHCVNLPLSTKQMMVMESSVLNLVDRSSSSHEDSNVLLRSGYDYINSLRRVTYISRELLHKDSAYSERIFPERKNPFEYFCTVYKAGTSKTQDEKLLAKAKSSYRFLKPEHKNFFSREEAHRNKKDWDQPIAEGKSLNNPPSINEETLLSRWSRVLSQWELTPHQLVFETAKEMEELKDPSLQGLFFQLFFRSPVSENLKNSSLGAGELILKDEALIESSKKFISNGLNYFINNKDDAAGGAFFFEFSFYLAKYLADAGMYDQAMLFDQVAEIDRWLNKKDITEEKKSDLHFYRFLFYSLKPNLSSEDYKAMYASWIIFNLANQYNSAYRSNTLLNIARRFSISETSRLWQTAFNNPKFFNQLGQSIFKRLNFLPEELVLKMAWKVDAELGWPYLCSASWKINLILGEVYGEGGKIEKINSSTPWEKTANFKRIFFKESGFSYHSIGQGNASFCHPNLGAFRLIKDSNSEGGYSIQRLFDNQWCEYLYNESPDDYCIWMPINSASYLDSPHGKIKGYVTRLKDQKMAFKVTENGLLVETDPDQLLPKPDNFLVSYLDAANPAEIEGFTRFESPKQILTYRKSDGKLNKLCFPRYVSLDGNTLAFHANSNGDLIWTENRSYCISKKMPKSYLGTIENYLYLSSTEGKKDGKILVPFQPIEAKKVPVASGVLAISNRFPLIPPTPELRSNEQHGLYQYFAYNVEDGEIKPTSLEGKLFLSYLHFSQKKYEHAIELLKSIKSVEVLSPICMKILDLMVKHPLGEDHPDAKMVLLHALSLSFRERSKQAKDTIARYFQDYTDEEYKYIFTVVQGYLNSLNNVSAECRMDREEELSLLSIVYKEKQFYWIPENGLELKHRIHFLQNNAHESAAYQKGERLLLRSGKYNHIRNGTLVFSLHKDFVDTLPYAPYYVFQTKEDRRLNRRTPGGFAGGGLNEDCYEEVLQKYYAKKAHFEERLPQAVKWLTEGSLSKQYTRPPFAMSLKYNGLLFQKVYKVAKSGNPSDKTEWLYRLLSWHKSAAKTNRWQLNCMIMILTGPDYFPDLIDCQRASDLKKYEFLKEIERVYNARRTFETFPSINKLTTTPARVDNSQPVNTNYYPLRPESAFENNEKPLSTISPDPIPLSINHQCFNERWEILKEWKQSYLIEDPNQSKSDYTDFSFSFDPSLLSYREENYRESIKNDLELLQQDYEAGKHQNESQIPVTITKDKCATLRQQVEAKLTQIKQERKVKKHLMLSKANRLSPDEQQRQAGLARLGGKAKRALNFEDCIEALLSQDQRHYRQKNEQLTETDIQEIAKETLEICDLKSYETQLQRMLATLKDIESISSETNPTRRYLCQKLGAEIDSTYLFDGFSKEECAALHVFAGETGLIPFKKQLNLIKEMMEMDENDPNRFRDIVIQLIMGGGKTSVIATIVLYLTAQKKKNLALFIVPEWLFETVKINFSESMAQAFKKQISALNVRREELTPYKISQIHELFLKSKEKGEPIVISATTIQCLELEFLSQSRKTKELFKELQELRSKGAPPSETKGIEERFNQAKQRLLSLAPIMELLAADGLLDEVDLVLECLQEVNFPEGEVIPIEASHNSLIQYLYETMTLPSLKVRTLADEPSIAEVVRLESNQQTEMSKETYLEHITPVLAAQLASNYKPLSSHLEGYQESFKRYATGKMQPALQHFLDSEIPLTQEAFENELTFHTSDLKTLQEDLAFLQHLRRLATSDKKNLKEAADLIALSKYVLTELTPAALSKSGRRDYGLKAGGNGKLIPYKGVNTPATTEFGNPLEAACYYYQWAAAFPPEKDQILDLAQAATTAAQYYVQKNLESFEETAEYEEFKEVFGVSLDEISIPEKMDQAIQALGKNVKKRLSCAYEAAGRFVTERAERYTSNGISLCRLLRSRRGMSGTPWNVEGFERSLAERYKPDIGTEGKILHHLATRANEGKIYEAELTSVDAFMGSVLDKHPTPEKIRGIIEAGGLFKAFKSNADVARELMDFLEKKQEQGIVNQATEGVLFFHHDPGQIQANTLYVWKKGAEQPERIGGTSVKELKAKGLDTSKYFVYYDENHTTGVDILQDPEAINLLTCDWKTPRRTFGQAIMRLRQFLFEQDVDLVVTKGGRESFINKGKEVNDLIINSEKVQSIRRTEAMIRYFNQQIDGIPRALALQQIKKAVKDYQTNKIPLEKLIHEIEKYERFFVNRVNRSYYDLHGRLEAKENTKKMLKEKLLQKAKAFEKVLEPSDAYVLQQLLKESKELSEHIDKSKCLPQDWKRTAGNDGIEVETAVQEETNTQTHVNVEVEQEVDLELQAYERLLHDQIRPESFVSESELKTLINQVRSGGESANLIALQSQLAKFNYSRAGQKFHYEKAFSQSIYGTHNYFNSCTGSYTLPVFHRMQRPPNQILAIRGENGKMHWLLLSEHETRDVQEHLNNWYKKESPESSGIWLIQPDGSPLIKGPYMDEFPDGETSVSEGLLEINAFAGNADYLERHAVDSESWLAKEPELKVRFLKLRTARNALQNRTLRRSPLISQHSKLSSSNQNLHLFQKRMEREKQRQGNYHPKSALEAKLLVPQRIRDLNVRWVHFLGIDFENSKKDPVTEQALKKLEEELPLDLYPLNSDKRAEALKEKIAALNQKQFASLSRFHVPHITIEQLQFLPLDKIAFLEKPEQIYREKNLPDGKKEWEYLLSEEQTKQLCQEQSHLIPYINPEFYQKFEEKWQIQAVPVEHVDKINENYWHLLSRDQVKNITKEKAQLIEKLPPEKLNWVSINYLSHIPPSRYNQICAEQIQEIDDPNLIPQLEEIAKKGAKIPEGLWTSWIHPQMILHINPATQLSYLKNREQICRIKDEWVELLDVETQIPLISSSQIHLLKDENQIKHCPERFVSELKKHQIQLINEKHIPLLRGKEQIRAIANEAHFIKLTGIVNAELGWINQMPWISDEQLKWIQPEQIPGLSNEQLLKLSALHPRWNELKNSISLDQIKRFRSKELVAFLNEKEIADHLQSYQVPFLVEQWQVQACPNALVHLLSDKQISLIRRGQVPYLRGEKQVRKIVDPDFFSNLKAVLDDENGYVNQMIWVADEQLIWIAKDQAKGLTPDQILKLSQTQSGNWETLRQELTKAQINLFDSKELINLLSDEQITSCLKEFQVPLLTKEHQIRACPLHLIPHLNVTQIASIKPDQVSALHYPWQIQACPAKEKLVHRFTKEQFIHLTAEQAALLSPSQIAQMDSVEEVDKLLPSQWKHLSKAAVQCLPDSYIVSIQKKESLSHLIPFIKPSQLHLVTNRKAAQKIAKAQAEKLSLNQINNLPRQHPIWEVVPNQLLIKIDAKTVKRIPASKISTLKHPKTIRSVRFKNVQYLTKAQLRKRTCGQFLAYTIGVMTLGFVSSLIALVAYSSLVPFGIALVNRKAGKRAMHKLNDNPRRLYRYLAVYMNLYKPEKIRKKQRAVA